MDISQLHYIDSRDTQNTTADSTTVGSDKKNAHKCKFNTFFCL